MHCALTIAGSDSGGGAGIQADLKTFEAFGVFGLSVITALTAQNTLGVQGIFPIPHSFVQLQLQSIFSDFKPTAVKTGMLAQADLIEAIDLVNKSKPDPIPMLLIGGDITPDTLADHLQAHQHLGMLDAEGDFFDQMSGKSYGSNARWGTVLKATTGDQIKSHRIGRGDGVVNNPNLIICTSVQPDVWLQLHGDKSASNRGVTQFLQTFPFFRQPVVTFGRAAERNREDFYRDRFLLADMDRAIYQALRRKIAEFRFQCEGAKA
jgi:hypothetical protein